MSNLPPKCHLQSLPVLCGLPLEEPFDFMKQRAIYGSFHAAAPYQQLVFMKFSLQEILGLTIHKRYW